MTTGPIDSAPTASTPADSTPAASTTADQRWRSECPIASSLDIVGDKWTLLVLRDLLDGKTRFSEFERSPESVPTNILTDRLRRLVAYGLADRVKGAGRRIDYYVTAKGEAMRPVLLAMAEWGNANVAGTWVPPHNYLSKPARLDG